MSLSMLSPLSSLFKLPNEVLSHVLANPAIPLGRRLRLRLLSNRCCDIIEDALKKESSLVIREKKAEYSNCKPDDLVIKRGGLTAELILTLSRLFSGITKLTLAFGDYFTVSASWSTVPSLLANFATNLTTVKLYGSIDDKLARPLADALVAISALTSLTLYGYYRPYRLSSFQPVLSRLVKFACNSSNWISTISASLSPRCTHLQIDHNDFTTFSGPFLAQLSTSLTNLHLQYCDRTTLGPSLSPMHTLTSLALDLNLSYLDSTVFSRLPPLTRLSHVKLYRLVYRTPLALPTKKEIPMRGIKHLTLEMPFNHNSPQFDAQAFCETLNVWLPTLVHFTLLTDPNSIHAIQGKLGQLPFSVKILDCTSVDNGTTGW